jgi:peroxiredoxin
MKQNIDTPIYAPDFELPGVDGQVHHLARCLEKYQGVAVVFISNCCPYVQSYLERLKAFQVQYSQRNFTIIAINSNDATQQPAESFENMKSFANQHQLNFPYLWDSNQDVASAFRTKVTPEAFLVDQEAVVRYQGAIDNNPESSQAVESPYLQRAIVSLLNKSSISVPQTQPVGSPMLWRS